MSDQPLDDSSAASNNSGENSASCQEFQESGEIFLASEGGWKSEAESVIKDVERFVKTIAIADKIQVRGSNPGRGRKASCIVCVLSLFLVLALFNKTYLSHFWW